MINKYDEQKEVLKGLFTKAALADIEDDRDSYNPRMRSIVKTKSKEDFTMPVYNYINTHKRNGDEIKINDINTIESEYKSLIIRSLADNKEEFHAIDDNYGTSRDDIRKNIHNSINFLSRYVLNEPEYMMDAFERDDEGNVEYVKSEHY